MKLKEYWPSWAMARQLAKLPIDDLLAPIPLQKVVPAVVSLTSIPSRLDTLHLTVRSLMQQTIRPSKIVLWLHEDLKNTLPESLKALQGAHFEVCWSPLTCSHRKLIHSLHAFPTSVIVTCDDDSMYAPNWLESLWETHMHKPHAVVGHACRQIMRDAHNELLPYKSWPFLRGSNTVSAYTLLPIGYAGVLYPVCALDDRTTETELFMQLAPKADDLWFRTMAFLKGTTVMRSDVPCVDPVPIIGSQKQALLKTNVREDANRDQLNAICQYFGIRL